MNGNEFLRKLKKHTKSHGLSFKIKTFRGKGSHSQLTVGERFTTLKDRRKEIGPGLLNKMLKDLGIDPMKF